MSAWSDKWSTAWPVHRRARGFVPLLAAAGVLVAAFTVAPPSAAAAQRQAPAGTVDAAKPGTETESADRPGLTLSDSEAGAGGEVTVSGEGWRPDAVITLLVCGQNAIGGTNSCANAEGRAATASGDGSFRKKLPVAEPPKACPCVVRATTATGEYASADAKFKVAGHPVKKLPRDDGGGRLSVLAARLEGGSGLLNWFGAPPQRELVLTVANLGAAQAKNPVFDVGTSHGVYSPEWERQQWRGSIDPGSKKQVKLPVELAAGAHGGYSVSAKYSDKLLTEQPLDVGRPWGVTIFWILLFLVVPAGLFRIGMAVVDRRRPRSPGQVVSGRDARTRTTGPESAQDADGAGGGRTQRLPLAGRLAGLRSRQAPGRHAEGTDAPPPPGGGGQDGTGAGALPWFTPDTLTTTTTAGSGGPGSGDTKISAPSDDRPPSKGNP